MTGALIILVVTMLTGLLLWFFDKKGKHTKRHGAVLAESEKASEATADAIEEEGQSEPDGFCCGQHAVCEKTSLSPLSTEITYYDDEELDRFAGKNPDDYNEKEEEEFRDILLTMRPEEVAGWSRSLQLRNINLPSAIREELLMIAAEFRQSRQQ